MHINPGTVVSGFTFTKCEELPEIEGTSYLGIHEKSGCKLLYLKNDDANKSFAIGFKTPPKDDTGVFHILEHSVLCGSRRFPVKEPFVDLLKTSMQTFLNAMTFPDKTLYPVASTNEKDLLNLMDVYLDAVFHPKIYEKRAIFEQEGWHFELQSPDNPDTCTDESDASQMSLVYNGVVFNEMKGALSDANSVLYDTLQSNLFKENCYAFESGGTPAAIPTLSYEEFLDEHRRHYRTDNSYIILYGNLDIERVLAFIDSRYLSPVADEQRAADEAREAEGLEPLRPRAIELQDSCRSRATVPMRTAPENACAGCAWVVGTSRDRTRVLAADILLDALLGSNEAPLKRRLLDMGLAHDIHAFVSDALLQPFAVVELQMPNNTTPFSFSVVIENEVKRLLDEGLDHTLIEAALSHEEFQMREHDFGTADGVVHAMNALSGWLYDDDAATDYLRYENAFSELRRELSNGYFEDLARTLFCENDHCAEAEIVPNPNAYDGGLAERLAAAQNALTPAEAERIDAEVALLRELQEAPDSPEAAATLPRLGISDIDDGSEEPHYQLVEGTPLPCMRHSVPTRGIAYAYRYFNADCMAFDELPYLTVLSLVLGKLDTAHHTAAELDTLAQDKLGNMSFFADAYNLKDDIDSVKLNFVVSASALSENASWLATLPREVMLETDFSDAGKILDILKQRKIMLEQGFINSGHACAASRVKSYYTRVGVAREQFGNVGFYRFLCNLIEHYEDESEGLANRLRDIAARIFHDGNCIMSFAGSDADFDTFWQANPTCERVNNNETRLSVPSPVMLNEAFVTPSDVCFASVGWDWRKLEASYDGTWSVAGRALSLDYLWNEVRVKGGAYGVGFQAQSGGNLHFYTYRDPHLDESLQRFAHAGNWLASFNPSPEEMDGFVVASIAKIDAPIKARALIRRQMGDYFHNRTPEDRRAKREQARATDVEAVRRFSSVVADAVDAHAMCAFGSRAILENSKAGFTVIDLIG